MKAQTSISPLAKRNNAADRVALLLTRMNSVADDASAKTAWATLFGLSAVPSPERDLVILHHLEIVHRQIDDIALFITKEEKDLELFMPAIYGAKAALMVTNLEQPFRTNKAHLPPQTIPLLQAVGQFMHTNERPLEREWLVGLLQAVDDMYQSVDDSKEMPWEVRHFVIAQLEFVERAIREYPVAGVSAFDDAVRDAERHWLDNSDVRGEAQANSVASGIEGLWGSIELGLQRAAVASIHVVRSVGTILNGLGAGIPLPLLAPLVDQSDPPSAGSLFDHPDYEIHSSGDSGDIVGDRPTQ